jgi:AAHS family 4-hydroxybenzoate transporter-like MFS transporter
MGGIITLSCLAYPTGIRSAGASWAMGAGRIGSIAGPLLVGLLLAFHLQPRSIFVAAFIPALCIALLMVMLGRLRHRQGHTA